MGDGDGVGDGDGDGDERGVLDLIEKIIIRITTRRKKSAEERMRAIFHFFIFNFF